MRPPWYFELSSASRLLTDQLGTLDLRGFGADELPLAICAAGALLQYVRDTQKAAVPHIRRLRVEERADALHAGCRHAPQSRAGCQPVRARTDATLFALLDPRVTSMGSRSCAAGSIGRSRISGAAAALPGRRRAESMAAASKACASTLRGIGDIERILSRVALRSRAAARPGADCAPRSAALPALRADARRIDSPLLVELARAPSTSTRTCADCCTRAIAAEPSAMLREGDVIAAGYDAELDELRQHLHAHR